jgi:serine phosphatase RsbU (regulator of sigma subunit)
VSLENHRLYDQVTEAKLIRQEMEIAHRLQQRLYPTDVPAIPGLRLFAEGQAARQVGGDYLALLPAAAGGIDFVVADVMGKGMSAAVFSFLTHVAVRSILRLRRRSSPGQVLTVLNRIMAPDLDRFGMFMTALFGRVDVGNGRVVYASAGHPPPLLVLPDGVTRFLPTHDYMLGVSSACLYRTLTAELTDGMKLVCYTDGLTDIVDDAGTMLGPKPMEETCRRLSSHTITEIGRALMDEALARSPQSGLQDDVAVIGIERLGHRSRRRTGAPACSGQGGRRRA